MITYERVPIRLHRWTATAHIGPAAWNEVVTAGGFTRKGARRNLERAIDKQYPVDVYSLEAKP